MLELIKTWRAEAKPGVFWGVSGGIIALALLLLFLLIWWAWPAPIPTDRDLLDDAADSNGQAKVHIEIGRDTKKEADNTFKEADKEKLALKERLAKVAKQAKAYEDTMKKLGEGSADWKALDKAAGVQPE